MWTQVQKMLHGGEEAATPPVVPLRKARLGFEDMAAGKVVRFSHQCPLPSLSGMNAIIIGTRHYRFGADTIKTHQLQVGSAKHYYLTIAEDEQGQYLGISRLLNDAEQEIWFGRDALGFFTEASSAKSIRCKVDMAAEGAWAAQRYAKSVDWVEGSVATSEALLLPHAIHYSLLVNEAGDKALEVEHDDVSDENRFFITVYRPIEDIAAIEHSLRPSVVEEKKAAIAPAIPANDDVPLFKEPALTQEITPPMPPAGQPKQRMDFRRLDESLPEIRITRTPVSLDDSDDQETDLPSFLLTREGGYLSLDNVIPPEAERVRVGLGAARGLIDLALRKNVRVRDILRNLVGLESAIADEVIFEMPLTDEDYRTLAMRYKLRPDHRSEIRARLEEELSQKLTGIAKA